MCSFNKSFMNYDFISYLFIYLQETKQRRQPKKAKLTNGRISSQTGQENPVPNGSKQNKAACSVFVMFRFFSFRGKTPCPIKAVPLPYRGMLKEKFYIFIKLFSCNVLLLFMYI